MKTLTYALLAAASACGLASAAATAYTTPVGYTTQTLSANATHLVGLNVLSPTVIAGAVTAVSGANITDTAANFTTLLTAGRTYVLEIKDGPGLADGTVQDFVTWAGDTITLPAALAGVAVGDKYSIRVAPTLGEIFTGTSVTASFTASGADIVWIPNGTGGYLKYWKNSTNWRLLVAGTGTDPLANSVSVLYVDGILVQKKATASSLVLSGEVKKTGSNTLIAQATQPVSVVAPVGSTLFNIGLSGDLTPSFTSSGADVVWVPTAPGVYAKYALKSPAPGTWFKLNASGAFEATAATDIALPPTIFIQRKTAGKVITMDVPASYSNL